MIGVFVASAILFIAASLMAISRIDSATGVWPLGLLINIGWPVGLLALVLGFASWSPDVVGIIALSSSALISLIVIVGVLATDRPSRAGGGDTQKRREK